MDKAILDRLRQTNRPISGETLASELGISRVALWKRVKSLKTWGYDIRATRKGYELLGDDGLAPADLTVGPPTLVFPETQSTMDEARKAAGNGAPSGTLILALRQNGGRGRFGRTWKSPPGGLYLSLVLRSALPPPCAGALVLETAGVLLDLIKSGGVKEAEYRWPNDILSGSGKLGGILLEAYGALDRADFYILGIGLNTVPVSVTGRETAALRELTSAVPQRRTLAAAIAERLRLWSATPALEAGRWDRFLTARSRPGLATLWDGRVVRMAPAGFTSRGELRNAYGGPPLAIGECRNMTYRGEEP